MSMSSLKSALLFISLISFSCEKQIKSFESNSEIPSNGNYASTALPNGMAATDTLDVYLIAGQSNATGADNASNLSSANSSWSTQNSNILYASRTSAQTFNGVTENLPWGNLRMRSNNGFGVEMSFGKSMFNNNSRYFNHNKSLAIIKCSVNGTSMIPVNTTFDNWSIILTPLAIQYFNSRIAEIYNSNNTFKVINVKGLLWLQGEADTRQGTIANMATYDSKLTAMVNSMRSNITGASNMKVLLFQLNELASGMNTNAATTAKCKTLNQKFVSLSSTTNSFYKYLVTKGEEMQADDGIHYTANSYIDLGIKAAAILK